MNIKELNAKASRATCVAPALWRAWLGEWALMLALLLAAFYPVLCWMYARWTAPDSCFSHGFLIPLISAYFVFKQRAQLARFARRPAKAGLALLLAGLLLFIAGGWLRVYFTSGFALLLCLAGLLVYWGGWQWVRRLWFPLCFLIFMLPLPEVAIARLNLGLKLLVIQAAAGGLEALGIPVVMDGASLHLERGVLLVGDGCSGLRSLLALIALGVLFAYCYGQSYSKGGGTRAWLVRGAVLAAIIPAALGANLLRIFLNAVCIHFFGQELLFRPLVSTSLTGEIDLHLLSGFLVFVFALLALQLARAAAEAVARGFVDEMDEVDKVDRVDRVDSAAHSISPRQSLIAAAILSGACALSFGWLYQPIFPRAGSKFDFPRQIAGWRTIAEVQPTPREIELLETENILTRVYRDEEGREVTMVLVYDASGERKMAHPQEICLAANGWEVLSQAAVDLPGSAAQAQRLLMERGSQRVLYYYWYQAGRYQTGSYLGAQARLTLARLRGIPGGAGLVRLSVAFASGREQAGEQTLRDFANMLMPKLAEMDTETRRGGDAETRRGGDAETRRGGDAENRI